MSVRILDLAVDPKDTIGVHHILKEVRPEWKLEDVKIEDFTEGYVNHMKCIYQKSDNRKRNALVIRIFGMIKIDGEEFPLEREYEMQGLQVGAALNISQPVYAIFKNGIVYRYAPGRTLKGFDIKNPQVVRLCARAAAKLNHSNLDDIKVFNLKGEKVTIDRKTNRIMELQPDEVMYKIFPDSLGDPERNKRFKKELPSKTELIDLLKKMIPRVKDNIPIVFCHNDFHIKNLVYDPDGDELSVLDYEGVGLAPEGSDIVRLFGLAPYWKMLHFDDNDYNYSDDDLLPYVRAYLEEKFQILGKSADDVTEKDIELLHWYMKIYWRALDLQMAAFGMMQLKSKLTDKIDEKELDPLELAIKAWNLYKAKEDFFWNSLPPQ